MRKLKKRQVPESRSSPFTSAAQNVNAGTLRLPADLAEALKKRLKGEISEYEFMRVLGFRY